jgi:hypothetical protein
MVFETLVSLPFTRLTRLTDLENFVVLCILFVFSHESGGTKLKRYYENKCVDQTHQVKCVGTIEIVQFFPRMKLNCGLRLWNGFR